MTVELLISIIIAAAPVILNLIAILSAVCGFSKKVTELKGEIVKTKEYETLKEELLTAKQENHELMKKLNELLTKIDHIQRN